MIVQTAQVSTVVSFLTTPILPTAKQPNEARGFVRPAVATADLSGVERVQRKIIGLCYVWFVFLIELYKPSGYLVE